MSRLPDGNYAIALTPLTEDGELDLNGLAAELEYAVSKKLAGVVVLGSNGEGPYLTAAEKALVIKRAGEVVKGRIALVAGCIAVGTREAVEYGRLAKEAGCNSMLTALPVYFGLDFDAVKRHYQYLAENAGIEITFYHVPECSGLVLKPEEIAEIVSIPGIDSMKLTVFHRDFIHQTIQLCWEKDCHVFIGTSLLLFEGMKMDAKGSFCPMSLVAADDMQSLYGLTRERKLEEAFAVQEKIRRGGCALFSGLDADPEIIKNGFLAIFNAPSASEIIHHLKPAHHLVKEALRLKGLPMTNQVRLPYLRASAKQSSWAKKLLTDFGWLGL